MYQRLVMITLCGPLVDVFKRLQQTADETGDAALQQQLQLIANAIDVLMQLIRPNDE